MKWLKGVAIICGTVVTVVKVVKDGDSVAIAALFGLISTIVGAEIATRKNA